MTSCSFMSLDLAVDQGGRLRLRFVGWGRRGVAMTDLPPRVLELSQQPPDFVERFLIVAQVGERDPGHHVVVERLQTHSKLASVLGVEAGLESLIDNAYGLENGFALGRDFPELHVQLRL